jgi:hypothetical protein
VLPDPEFSTEETLYHRDIELLGTETDQKIGGLKMTGQFCYRMIVVYVTPVEF